MKHMGGLAASPPLRNTLEVQGDALPSPVERHGDSEERVRSALVLVVAGLVLTGCSNASLPRTSASAALPSPNAPFTWGQDVPPSCSEPQPESQPPGVFVGRLLMDPADRWPGPWTSQTEFSVCIWAEVGTVDYGAKTVQLLMKDTKTGAQKGFTGHLGEVVNVGRFTVKVALPTGGTAAVFEVDIYWR